MSWRFDNECERCSGLRGNGPMKFVHVVHLLNACPYEQKEDG